MQAVAGGWALVEATIAMAMMTILGLVLLKLALTVVAPRQWNLQQAITDAYLSYEVAYAERITFETLTGSGSPWPVYPLNTQTPMELGKLPGGQSIIGTVIRTRIPDANNLSANGGSGTSTTNPSSMNTWQVMSMVQYQVGMRSYVKSRTVLRFQ